MHVHWCLFFSNFGRKTDVILHLQWNATFSNSQFFTLQLVKSIPLLPWPYKNIRRNYPWFFKPQNFSNQFLFSHVLQKIKIPAHCRISMKNEIIMKVFDKSKMIHVDQDQEQITIEKLYMYGCTLLNHFSIQWSVEVHRELDVQFVKHYVLAFHQCYFFGILIITCCSCNMWF